MAVQEDRYRVIMTRVHPLDKAVRTAKIRNRHDACRGGGPCRVSAPRRSLGTRVAAGGWVRPHEDRNVLVQDVHADTGSNTKLAGMSQQGLARELDGLTNRVLREMTVPTRR